jgi:hypothetical protein
MSVKQDDLPSVTAVQLRRAGELTLGTRNVRVKLGEVEPVMGVVLRQPSALRLLTDARARTGVRPSAVVVYPAHWQKGSDCARPHFASDDERQGMGYFAHPRDALGRLVLLQWRGRARAALLHHRLVASRFGRRGPTDCPAAGRVPDPDAGPRLARLLRDEAPQHCAALRAHRLGTAQNRERFGVHP